MYGNRILYRIATDHQAEERRIAAELRRTAVAEGTAGEPGQEVDGRAVRRASGRRFHLPRLGRLFRRLGASGA